MTNGGSGRHLDFNALLFDLDSDVEYAVPDRRKRIVAAPNDPLYAASGSVSPAVGQWYLRAPDAITPTSTTTVVSAINAEGAWNFSGGSSSISCAISFWR